jgi:xylan 1,4-beta-xylosidase
MMSQNWVGRWIVVVALGAVICLVLPPRESGAQVRTEAIEIDTVVQGTPFPHYWERMFGSGRAILSLRDSYRKDLRSVKEATGFEYIRFHAIFHDEVGVYDEAAGAPLYNFSYVDQIYDGLLQARVRPFVEVSFMPKKLAMRESYQAFWYRPIVSPPKDWARWDDLVTQFARHLIERYGIEEVSQWYFEVWNEPNIDFWAGEPKQSTYWQLYDHTALALKKADPKLRVGGPATAQAAWVSSFIAHATANKIPYDFVSTHIYANDLAHDVFGTDETIPRTEMVCRAVKKVHDEVKSSVRPEVPVIFSEYNASYKNEPNVTDALFMGPWLADTIRQCDGLVDNLAYWSFSDVFEEQGVVKQPFYGGYGLMAAGNLPKPAFNAFKLLHQLGEKRLPVNSQSALATRKADGTLEIAVWNLHFPEEYGETKEITLTFRGLGGTHSAKIARLDETHGSLLALYSKMGGPRYPSQKQLEELRLAGALPAPEETQFQGDKMTLRLPPQGLAVIEIQ